MNGSRVRHSGWQPSHRIGDGSVYRGRRRSAGRSGPRPQGGTRHGGPGSAVPAISAVPSRAAPPGFSSRTRLPGSWRTRFATCMRGGGSSTPASPPRRSPTASARSPSGNETCSPPRPAEAGSPESEWGDRARTGQGLAV